MKVTKNFRLQNSDILKAKENIRVGGGEKSLSVALSCLIFLMEKLLQMGSSAYVINFIILASCQLSIKPWFLWFQLQLVKLMWALTETDKRTFFKNQLQVTIWKAFFFFLFHKTSWNICFCWWENYAFLKFGISSLIWRTLNVLTGKKYLSNVLKCIKLKKNSFSHCITQLLFFYNNEDNELKNAFFPYEDNVVKLCKENAKFNSKIGTFFIIPFEII